MTEKYKLQQEDINSMDLNSETLTKLKQILPEVFSEGADGKYSIDVEKLKIALGGAVDVEADDKTRYSFGWSGKKQAQALANKPSNATLRPAIDESKNWDDTQNIYIEGDNLEVLKLLQKSYYGQIKMIYIDPPYNTGKDFVYKDNFHDNVKNYLQLTGQVDDEGNKISTNTDKSGRYHTDWLNMMYPRLKLARNLLKADGVILINIDENEVANLQKICDEIFGEDNNLGSIIWDKRNPKGETKGISCQHEYIILFAKNLQTFSEKCSAKRPKKNAEAMIKKAKQFFIRINSDYSFEQANVDYAKWVSSQQNFSGGEKAYNSFDNNGNVYQAVSMAAPDKPETRSHSPLRHPVTQKNCPVPAKGWRFTDESMNDLLKQEKIVFGKDENTQPRSKYLLQDNMFENIASLLYYGGSDVDLLDELGIPFDTPKVVNIVKEHIQALTSKNDIILDFFSGSATTAHAVMQLNAEDGGSRKYICVQLPEPTYDLDKDGNEVPKKDSIEAYNAGYKNICEIGKERIRRAGEKVLTEWAEKQQKPTQASADAGLFAEDAENSTAQTSLDIGFKVFKLDTSNLKPFDANDMFADDLLVADRSALDLFYELVLKQGYSLDNRQCVLDIGGTRCYALVHEDNTSFVLAVLDDTVKPNFALELIKYALTLVIVKDACFGTDEIKLNLLATLEQLQNKDNPLQIRIV
ncbi:MAG TPA: site-specific DNA-methyltransferase [Burkholderiales bacterium]|nr:site-specific DNA-methyltransferase [Burkholderiales bacterium]